MKTTQITIQTKSLNEVESAAKEFVSFLKEQPDIFNNEKGCVVGLIGDLGAGKTTFSQAIAKQLGVEETVTSPTFVIEKIYKTKNVDEFETFVHIDAYRIEHPSEMQKLKFEELIKTPKTLIFIEWPENIQELLPKDAFYIRFGFVDENTREITY